MTGDLSKSIGPLRGTAMMLNIVLGAGLLTLPGLAAQVAGAGAILVWLACAIAAAPLLLVFALLGREHPDAGGIAAYLASAFGLRGRAVATYLFLGAVAVGLPAIALTGGHYAAAILGGSPHLYAALLLVAGLSVNFLSAERAGAVNAAVASLILVVILALAGAGWLAVRPELGDLAPGPLPSLPVFGLAFMMIFFAFTGWEVAANLSGEFRNPRRDLPLAMGLSFGIAVLLYLVLAVIVAASGPVGATEAPFAAIFGAEFGPGGARAVAAVAVVMIFANLSAAIWAVSRMVYSAAKEGLLPARLEVLSNGVPLAAVTATAGALLLVLLIAGFGLFDLERLLAAAGQNFLLLYAGAAAALVRLSGHGGHRVLGIGCLLLTGGLIAVRFGPDLLYPTGLVAAGLLMAWIGSGRQVRI